MSVAEDPEHQDLYGQDEADGIKGLAEVNEHLPLFDDSVKVVVVVIGCS